MIFIVLISFVIFSGNGLSGAAHDVAALFGGNGLPFFTKETGYYLLNYSVILLVGIIGSTPLTKSAIEKVKATKNGAIIINILEPVFVFSVLLIVTAYFVDGSFSPFLYFRF